MANEKEVEEAARIISIAEGFPCKTIGNCRNCVIYKCSNFRSATALINAGYSRQEEKK